jgi:hypothetical protein
MSKINIGDEIAFRHEYEDETKTGYVKSIKRFAFWKIYLVVDGDFNYHVINNCDYYIMPTGYKRDFGEVASEQ